MTDLKYNDDLTALEIKNLFTKKQIKYVLKNNYVYTESEKFLYEKMKDNPNLFSEISCWSSTKIGEDYCIWQIY
jgi:hypothetical protein